MPLYISSSPSGAAALARGLGIHDPDPLLFNTGVTIPIGNTVVLGSTIEDAGVRAAAGERALILTVRPTIDATKRRD